MKCDICGSNYTYSCAHCTRRVATWGVDGLLYLMSLAKSGKDIDSLDLVPIIEKYYCGQSKTMSARANVLRSALRLLGYKGNFVGRIHQNGETYTQFRKREHEAGRRYGLRRSVCDMCGGDSELRLHHIVPLSWGGKSTEDNCITLCERCHRDVHKRLATVLSRERLIKYLAPHQQEIEALAKQSVE